MKDKPTEWVSISDLLAGVLAIVMLMLVMSVIQKKVSEAKLKSEIQKSEAAQKSKISSLLKNLETVLKNQGVSDMVAFDLESGKMTLKDSVFERGSACVTPDAKHAFNSVEGQISSFLLDAKGGQVFVDGHTDNLPVQRPVTDFVRFCSVYDDNYTLSAARAREVRKLLIGTLDNNIAKNVIVAGYGDSQPLNGIQSSDPKNRRVEIHFSTKDQLGK